MHEFRMLGGIGLTGNDGEVDALLRRPKRVALLGYLAGMRALTLPLGKTEMIATGINNNGDIVGYSR